MPNTTVKLNRIRQSAQKVRLLADMVRGKPAEWASQQLAHHSHRAARPMLKLIKSGIASANAKNMEPSKLRIEELRVDEGRRLKRWLPAPRGRSYNIRKPTSHITLVLSDEVNPKSEARSTKQIQNLNVQKIKTVKTP